MTHVKHRNQTKNSEYDSDRRGLDRLFREREREYNAEIKRSRRSDILEREKENVYDRQRKQAHVKSDIQTIVGSFHKVVTVGWLVVLGLTAL